MQSLTILPKTVSYPIFLHIFSLINILFLITTVYFTEYATEHAKKIGEY